MPRSANSMDNEKRLEVLKEILMYEEQQKKVNFTEIGKKFSIDRTTVAKISKTREIIKESIASGNLLQKRKRPFKEEEIDKALFEWVDAKLQEDQDARLNMPILKSKAAELANAIGHEFIPSDGWLSRFKARHSLKFKKPSMGVDATANFKQYILPRLLRKHVKENIFCADETGLYYKSLPDWSYQPTGKILNGEEEEGKERVTVLVCANMSGSEKRRLMVIGKSKHPRCFPQDFSTLPVTYTNSFNAWMTEALFQDHLEEWNRSLRFQERKILLLIDSCIAHPSDMSFSNIEIVYLPTNTTSSIQPMVMGVIRKLKAHYRKKINERITAELDVNEFTKPEDAIKTITLLDAIFLLSDAWDEVQEETIKNSYRKAGFVEGIDSKLETDNFVQPPKNMSSDEFNAIIDQDENLEVCGSLSYAEITQEVKRRKMDSEYEEGDGHVSQPHKQQLLASVNTMRTFFQGRGKPHLMSHFKILEKDIFQALKNTQTQPTIVAMFANCATQISQ